MRIRLRDVYAGLAALLRAGVVTGEAVAQLRTTGLLPDPVGGAVAESVSRGRPLSEGLACFPDEIPGEDVAFIEAGEATGRLPESLDRLALYHDERRRAARRLLTRAGYPLLIYHLAAFLTPLPGAMAADGRLFGPSWLVTMVALLLPLYAGVAVVLALQRKERGRRWLRRILSALPGFGAAARHRRRARLAAVLGAGYEAGIRIDRALELAARAAGEERALASAAAVAEGTPLAVALAATAAVPPRLVGRLRTGEEAGELTGVLDAIAAEESETAEMLYARSMGILARLLYVAVALWVLFYALSTLVKAYSFPGV
ncbi:MAG: type II secretion system F family protein [Planctomycetota bacterium]|jgi:type II secretory pathway component PulF